MNRHRGVSTAEFVRRRIGPDDLEDHRQEIEALLATLEESAPVILRSLDEATAAAAKATRAVDSDLKKRKK